MSYLEQALTSLAMRITEAQETIDTLREARELLDEDDFIADQALIEALQQIPHRNWNGSPFALADGTIITACHLHILAPLEAADVYAAVPGGWVMHDEYAPSDLYGGQEIHSKWRRDDSGREAWLCVTTLLADAQAVPV